MQWNMRIPKQISDFYEVQCENHYSSYGFLKRNPIEKLKKNLDQECGLPTATAESDSGTESNNDLYHDILVDQIKKYYDKRDSSNF